MIVIYDSGSCYVLELWARYDLEVRVAFTVAMMANTYGLQSKHGDSHFEIMEDP